MYLAVADAGLNPAAISRGESEGAGQDHTIRIDQGGQHTQRLGAEIGHHHGAVQGDSGLAGGQQAGIG
jgi:hypothetical protein